MGGWKGRNCRNNQPAGATITFPATILVKRRRHQKNVKTLSEEHNVPTPRVCLRTDSVESVLLDLLDRKATGCWNEACTSVAVCKSLFEVIKTVCLLSVWSMWGVFFYLEVLRLGGQGSDWIQKLLFRLFSELHFLHKLNFSKFLISLGCFF